MSTTSALPLPVPPKAGSWASLVAPTTRSNSLLKMQNVVAPLTRSTIGVPDTEPVVIHATDPFVVSTSAPSFNQSVLSTSSSAAATSKCFSSWASLAGAIAPSVNLNSNNCLDVDNTIIGSSSSSRGSGVSNSGVITGTGSVISSSLSPSSKIKVEITFRPDRELKQPEGCEWLERRLATIDLTWDWMYLKTFLEDTVRRHLSELEQQAWASLPSSDRSGHSRAETIRVWGIRAVGVDIVQRDGKMDVQLYDREQKWKVDMSWGEFLRRLPAHKRVNKNNKPAWTLYLAYDMGISLHRDLRGKPKALLS